MFCPLINNMVFWSIGNGRNINIWYESWVAPGLLLNDSMNNLTQDQENTTVADLTNENTTGKKMLSQRHICDPYCMEFTGV